MNAWAVTVTLDVAQAFIDNEKPDGGETNPFGSWSYGYSSSATNPLTLFVAGNHTDAAGAGTYPDLEGYSALDASVLANVGAGNVVINNGPGNLGPIQPGTMMLHPGSGASSAFAIVEWTTPLTTTYTINADFFDIDPYGGNGVDVGINWSGGSSSQFLQNAGTSLNSGGAVLLNQNTTIRFFVGNAGEYSYDATRFNGTISYDNGLPADLPEPAQYGALFTALGLMSLQRMRRRAAARASA